MVKKEYICNPGKNSKIIIEDNSVEINEGSTIILGFTGIGLLGPIISNTLIEQIEDIEEIGFVTSEFLPPIAVFYDGILKHPFRLFYSPQHNIIVMNCEVPFRLSSDYCDLAKTICNWALSEDVKAKEIVIFQGIPRNGIIEVHPVYYASEAELIELLEKFGINKVEKGIILGPEAMILNEAIINRLDVYILFTPVLELPTPEGAAAIIKVLNQIYNLNIDIDHLIEEGKEIKFKMLELA